MIALRGLEVEQLEFLSEVLRRQREASPAAGIRSGEPFMVFSGVILTAQAARGPDEIRAHIFAHEKLQT